jgi:glycine oxidase
MPERDLPRQKTSVVILGAGVAGLSAALRLLQRGNSVTLLERGGVGAESSWAGGGILSPLLPWDYPEPLSGLALKSMASYSSWVENIENLSGLLAEYWQCGMRVLEVMQPAAALVWCKAHGLVAQREHMRSGNSLWLPDIAQVRNPRLVSALREAVVRGGGVIQPHSAVERLTSQGNRIAAAHTANEVFKADQFVLASGAWSGISLPGLAGVPNIRPIRGQMLLFRLEPGALESIVYRNGLYLIPRLDGHVLVGSTLEDAGFDKSTDAATRQRLHAEAAELLPALAGLQPVQHWAGLRPGSPDNIPVIDRHPDFDNVFVNAGHYRYGVTMAPASAELLVDLMEDRQPALDPAPYRWQAAVERRWTETL